jgi:hypothetical protein
VSGLENVTLQVDIWTTASNDGISWKFMLYCQL